MKTQMNMKKTKHTPLPWGLPGAIKDSDGDTSYYFPSAVGRGDIGRDEVNANCRLLKQAVNSHYELVEALRTCADWLSRSVRIDDREMAEDARAVIAKAEGASNGTE